MIYLSQKCGKLSKQKIELGDIVLCYTQDYLKKYIITYIYDKKDAKTLKRNNVIEDDEKIS